MNNAKVAAALNTISLAFGELAEALGAEQGLKPAAPVLAAPEGIPDFPPSDYEDLPFGQGQIESTALGRCPAHDQPWTVKAAGVSKMGKSYSAFWKCDARDGDVFCNRKPVKAWAEVHPL